ncbi:MAG: hypothetical protein ACKOCD_09400 [Nitrospiraceae bacterium]
MSKVEQLEREIEKLSRTQLAKFRNWFQRHDAAEWDHQIEADAQTGRLDKLADNALAAHKAGKTKAL